MCAKIGLDPVIADHSAQIDALTAEAQAALYPAITQFTITRNGKKVGTHTLAFSSEENRLSVAVESNIKVTILKIPVFRFNYVSTELWANNQLMNVTARTNQA